MQVKVLIMRGKDVLFDETHVVQSTDTVLSLKSAIRAAHGFATDIQRLHCDASLMEDDKTFGFYGIQDGQRLYDLLMA